MKEATATNFQPQTLTMEDIDRDVKLLERNLPPTEWVLAAPDGRVWKGKPEELLQVLMPYHPLLKPMSFGQILKDTP